MKAAKINKTKYFNTDKILDIILKVIIVLFLATIIYPLIYVVSSSFSSGEAVTTGRVLLFPVDFTLYGYELIFSFKQVWTAYANTIFYAVVGTMLNLVLTILVAYPLSRKKFLGKGFATTVFAIPMFFGGGLIPTYILMSNFHLVDTRLVILLSGTINIYNMIIMRTFFQTSIPYDLYEAAVIDGITDFGYLFKIVLPLSKAIISVVALYYMVGHWNAYFTPMIYLTNKDLQPLQIILREILRASRIDASQITDGALLAQMASMSEVMKYSLIVVSTLPMLIIYPYVQKFFEKGVMIGSVKG